MADFIINREDFENGGALTARTPGKAGQAKMTFSNAGSKMRIVDHTEVDDALRGTGAGLALASRMVEEARKDGVTLVPLCPFFLATAKKHSDWHDVIRMP